MAAPATKTYPYFSQPILPEAVPILYEDEDEGEMGESNIHAITEGNLFYGISAHLREHHPELVMFANMNLHYKNGPPHPRTGALPYVSPDGMVVKPFRELPEEVHSYSVGKEGPAPILTAEVLSRRTGQQGDLKEKLIVCAFLKVPEYVLIDVTGRYLKQKLLLKRLGREGQWQDQKDADGGITSRLGFRLILDPEDGQVRVLDSDSGHRYLRPSEAEAERMAAAKRLLDAERARQAAEEKVRDLETELAKWKKRKSKRSK